jgi:outer membrane protein OmpA-like peptidoglycan-associated protein
VLPFDDAVLAAANNLLGKAQLPPDTQWEVVIDPLIDGVTGTQTQATRAMGTRIVKIIKESFPRYAVQPFNSSNLQRGPLLLVGTFTGVNAERKTEGKRVAYRICLALADLKTGKLVSKGLAFADAEGVDATPLPYFRDAPAWLEDATTEGYVRTCQGTRAGDAIHPAYIDRVRTSATLAEANDAYAAGRYAAARQLYEAARSSPGGEQLRTYTGLYLTNWRLGNRTAAADAFGRIVDQGLENKRLGMKFLFRPGTAALWSDAASGPPAYPLWMSEIAKRAAARQSCLEVVGHASASGPEPLNERLSLLRAEAVRNEIARQAPPLAQRMIANGVGSKQTLIGTGRDDVSDALDRRVEFKVVGC